MKLYLPLQKKPHTGKHFFIKKLFVSLSDLGIEVSSDISQTYDIALHITKIKNKVKSKKTVIRINGIIHNVKQKYREMNSIIRQSADKSDGFIFQSQFSQIMFEKYVGIYQKPKKIINNGSNIIPYNVNAEAYSDFDHNFLAFSRWRPHKRLKNIVSSFLMSDIDDSCLWIAGDLEESGIPKKNMKKYFCCKNIKYLGILSHDMLNKYLFLSDAVLHLCWLDWCPNSVVESICANKIVICNNAGGTHEIVKPSGGIVCEIDKPYNLEPVDLYNPPKINDNIVADAIVDSVENPSKINNSHVDINNVAKKYKSFFELVFGE